MLHQHPPFVTTDPEIQGGVPCFSGTRAPIDTILACLAAGMSWQELEEWLPGITGVHIEAARTYQAEHPERRRLGHRSPLKVGGLQPGGDGTGLEAALRRGQERLAKWATDGVLVPGSSLASSWGWSIADFRQVRARGDIFAVDVAGHDFFPAAWSHLEPLDVIEVCRVQHQLSPSQQLVFWLKKHGGLRGSTVREALTTGNRTRVLELAAEWTRARAA